MTADLTMLQTALLTVLSRPNADRRLGKGRHYLFKEVLKELPSEQRVAKEAFMEAVWALISQGLAFIDFSQSAPENWELKLTRAGQEAAFDQGFNPDNAGQYLRKLQETIPDLSSLVLRYTHEAVHSYVNRCYLASAVMLGVASEAAFFDLAEAFANWLPESEDSKFRKILDNPRKHYISKFEEFRKRIQSHKSKLPPQLADNMALMMDSILDLLRIYRNDAAHPTGKEIERGDAQINLQMFARYLKRMYDLKAFFEGRWQGRD
jgi:hypothetical protein